jgi:hypothetical protein
VSSLITKEQGVMSAGQRELDQRPVQVRETRLMSRYLDPIDIVGELLTGTTMALSFTLGAALIAKGGHDGTKKMLVGVLGCNVAWGIIDGTSCLMRRMFELSRKARLLESIRASGGGEGAVAIVADELNEELVGYASPKELDQLYRQIAAHLSRAAPERIHLKKEDFYEALITLGLMCATTLPAVAPFLVFSDRDLALRVSNGLLLIILFLAGYRWGRITRSSPWVFGLAVLLIGLVMVAIQIWLEPR